MLRILSSFSFLDWAEIGGSFSVASGCLGELWLLVQKPPLDPKELQTWDSKKHFLERIFVTMVAFGVSLELVCLPISLRKTAELVDKNLQLEQQIAETSTNVVKIDPLNQLVSDIFILATINVKGTNFVESPLWGSPAVAWVELCDNRTNVGRVSIQSSDPFFSTLGEFSELQALDFNRVNFMDGQSPGHGYILRFQPNPLMLGSGFRVTYPPKAIDVVSNLHMLLISTKFIPHDSEIMSGAAYLVLNGCIRMHFDILPQKALSSPHGYGTGQGDSGFTLIATNGTVAPMPRIDK